MFKLKDPSLVPPGGFAYRQPETGAIIDGQSLRDTAILVEKHRKANGLDRATFQESLDDVQHQICLRVPGSFCVNSDPDKIRFTFSWDAIKAGTITLAAWAEVAIRNGNPYVDQAEAERRASICSTCFANSKTEGCVTCGFMDSVRDLISKTCSDKSTSKDSDINACGVCGCLIKCKVHLKEEILAPGITDKQAAMYADIPRCWMAQIKK